MKPTKRRNVVACILVSAGLLSAVFFSHKSSARRVLADDVGQTISPAGSLVFDSTTRQPAVGALPVDFVRSPDKTGPDGGGRYLIAVNSGYGIQFNAAGNRGQQSLAVIDLNARPAPQVVQNVYFPSPQSVNVGVAFSPVANEDGSYLLYVSGGFENKIWIFRFTRDSHNPITPTSPGPNTTVEAPFIDLEGFANAANSPRYNSDRAPVYPFGISISADGNTLFVANNLADSLGIVSNLQGERKLDRVDLRHANNREQFIYPYAVVSTAEEGPRQSASKVYVSCWNDASVAVVHPTKFAQPVSYIGVGQHPTALLFNTARTRLYVANSNDDSVSVIDTLSDKEIERINVRLSERFSVGNSPEGLALSGDRLLVANAHSNSLAVVRLSERAQGLVDSSEAQKERSKVLGFIPTGRYASAVAIAGRFIFIGNGKGTGVENSSLVVNNSGAAPNQPNDRFPAGAGRGSLQGGQYSVSLVVGNISAVLMPEDLELARYTQQVMRNNGLLGPAQAKLFPGASPIRHVIYIIKENRSYDQVFGDLEKSGDGTRADGDSRLAIFGAGDAAARPNGARQNVAPNHHALALRFGLFDRFFVNAEASPDGHNWSTAAFSSDYVDKSYRLNYSRRGRGYDFEGFNRLPNYEPVRNAPSLFGPDVVAEDIANFMRRFVPYLRGSHDVAEPQSLYLWDAAARAGLTYRNYGEFIATLSAADVTAIRLNRAKPRPDLSPSVSAFATKKSLENHFNPSFRNFDLGTPDAMTPDSYSAAVESNGKTSALIDDNHVEPRFRGTSRLGVWLKEFRAFVANRESGNGDQLPNLSIMRLPNDHTDGLVARQSSPQFFVADNDYALGLLVEAVSNSPYWSDTAIFVVEDDAQDGPDHVDAHRSVALVISAYNRPGALVHEVHSTVSLIRTIELLLGIAPMNQLDAAATPMNIFRPQANLQPYQALLPNVALDNLITPPPRDAATAYWMKQTEQQDISHADMADPEILNRIIWFSVKGAEPMPQIRRSPVFDALRLGMREERGEFAKNYSIKDRD